PPARPAARTRSIAWPMAVLTTLFFMWGFMTVLNDVLIPHLKAVFTLSWWQSMLVQFCFFGAYFLGSLAYYFHSSNNGDPIQRMGYKRALIAGLVLSAAGSALFVPATYVQAYGFYLLALFVLGLGFTLLQIAANPFVAIIGTAEGASSRLNLAQGFNSLGTTLAPLIGGALIFGHFKGDAAVRWPYAFFAALLLLQALWVYFTALPEPPHTTAGARQHALRHRQLRNGMVAIFCYVGAEVAIGSLIIGFLELKGVMGLEHNAAKNYLSLYWGGAMCGRFLGAVALSDRFRGVKRLALMLGIGAALFLLLGFINQFSGGLHLNHLWPLALLITANMAVFVLAGRHTGKVTGLFAGVAGALVLFTMFSGGATAMWAILAVGLFNSILWSNIFTLSIHALGTDTGQGSSLLVMMILGGALVPVAQGALIDALQAGGLGDAAMHLSFLLPLLCYGYLAWFGFQGSKPQAMHQQMSQGQ
ncbi:MAG: sugar MFS transporter, partial [Flavobacteriales bacterium]|nr:sugar MFS transporter [Flavobacteriales bacterium]